MMAMKRRKNTSTKTMKYYRTVKMNTEFSPGQIVVLKSDPSVKGAVVGMLPGHPESQIRVFVSGNVQT